MLRALTMGLLTQVIRPESFDKISSIILRLPGLFILDYYYQTYSKDEVENNENRDYTSIINTFMVFQATLFILLPLKPLMEMYKHYLSVGLLGYAELYSRHYVSRENSKEISNIGLMMALSSKFNVAEGHISYFHHHVEALCLHVIITAAVAYLLNVTCRVKKALLSVYTVPVVARLISMPLEYLDILHKFSGIVMGLCILVYCLSLLYSFFSRSCKQLKSMYRNLQSEIFQNPIEIHIQHILCDKFYVMPQFFVFWCSLLAVQLCRYWYPQIPHIGTTMLYPSEKRWYLLFLYAVSEICASPLSLVASCITIMYTSWAVLSFTTVLAKGPVMAPHLARLGTGEGVTMALLSLQTGLVDLPMPQRIGAMSVILFIVLGSLVQSMHELVEPTLLSLCTSQSYSLARHARVLLVCIFLFVFPLYMTFFLCRLFDVDFWTLVVVSTCALTSVQVLGALTVYGLFMYDSLQKDSGWESLDDVVYIARAVIRVLEFIVAVLVVGAGVRESIVLSSEGRPWSWLNGSVLAIHFYFNVYQRLQSGWRSFLLRREAARKIHSLPNASEEQLEARAHDVCAICYMEMRSACVTPCTHLFHAPCLKKWLYVQDRCPLCSAQIVFTRGSDDSADKGMSGAQAPLSPPSGSNDLSAGGSGVQVAEASKREIAGNIYCDPSEGNPLLSQVDDDFDGETNEEASGVPNRGISSAVPYYLSSHLASPFLESGCRYRGSYAAYAASNIPQEMNENYMRNLSGIDRENGNGQFVMAQMVSTNPDNYGHDYYSDSSQYVTYRHPFNEGPILTGEGEIIRIPANFKTCECLRFPEAYRFPGPIPNAYYSANTNINSGNWNINEAAEDNREYDSSLISDTNQNTTSVTNPGTAAGLISDVIPKAPPASAPVATPDTAPLSVHVATPDTLPDTNSDKSQVTAPVATSNTTGDAMSDTIPHPTPDTKTGTTSDTSLGATADTTPDISPAASSDVTRIPAVDSSPDARPSVPNELDVLPYTSH